MADDFITETKYIETEVLTLPASRVPQTAEDFRHIADFILYCLRQCDAHLRSSSFQLCQVAEEFTSRVMPLLSTEFVRTKVSARVCRKAPSLVPWITKQFRELDCLGLKLVWQIVELVFLDQGSMDVRSKFAEDESFVAEAVRVFESEKLRERSHGGVFCSLRFLCEKLGPSPYWSTMVRGKDGLDRLKQLCLQLHWEREQDVGLPELKLMTSRCNLKTFFILATSSREFINFLSTQEFLIDSVLLDIRLICEGFLFDEKVVESCMKKFVEGSTDLLNTTSPAQPLSPDSASPKLGSAPRLARAFVESLSGTALILLSLIAGKNEGAEFVERKGQHVLRLVRVLVTMYGEEELKGNGLWNLAVRLASTCVLGTISESSDHLNILGIRRFRHSFLILPCGYCKQMSVGSRDIKACSNCHLVRYCGRTCQQLDWQKSHGVLCSK